MIIKREEYLKKIRPFYNIDLIKVITGVRRCGKSKLLESIIQELLDDGIKRDHIIYINFEDMDYEHINTAAALNKEVKSYIIDSEKYYIFLDEIQHVSEFEKAIASFKATLHVSVFVTGSNSKLLSGELATVLTGRTVEFEIQTFSFLEVKAYYDGNSLEFSDDIIYDYIKWGGFPQRFELKQEQELALYLKSLYESIIHKDIMVKSNSFDMKMFETISSYMIANAGKEYSVDNIVNYYNNQNSNNKEVVTRQTVYNYIEKMEKAFLIRKVKRYNIVGKEALKTREKKYVVDMGFRTICTNTINYEDTFFLENIIYNELIFQGYSVFTGKTYKGEVDFVAIKSGKKCFIQVCYLLATKETIDREFGAFKPISDSSPKYVLSLDKLDFSKNGIVHMNIIDFLLHKKELVIT